MYPATNRNPVYTYAAQTKTAVKIQKESKMTISQRDARTLLEHFEGIASSDPYFCFTRNMGDKTLMIFKENDGFKYQWGGNYVSKFIAIAAIQTFTVGGSR